MRVDKKVKREEESRKIVGRLDFSVMEGTVSSENEQPKNQKEFRGVQGIEQIKGGGIHTSHGPSK